MKVAAAPVQLRSTFLLVAAFTLRVPADWAEAGTAVQIDKIAQTDSARTCGINAFIKRNAGLPGGLAHARARIPTLLGSTLELGVSVTMDYGAAEELDFASGDAWNLARGITC